MIITKLIDKLEKEKTLSKREFVQLMTETEITHRDYLFERAAEIRQSYYGRDVYVRGLIEFTNYCKNDCYYCGIRAANREVERYRLTKENILACCHVGYNLGFRTFVLQGGEDTHYSDCLMVDIIQSIKMHYPDCAVTLSVGEQSYETFKRYREAGADRYLLRHETANEEYYQTIHPPKMSSQKRKQSLMDLKSLGFQFGTGFMVGSPGQTPELLAEDLLFIHQIQPHMVGIGPFIPHHQTPFADKPAGSVELTLLLIGILRLMLPPALLPATTALGTLDMDGRERGILAGANVVMPNLSPLDVRNKYMIYDNKIATGLEAAEAIEQLKERLQIIGYEIVVSRGDYQFCPEIFDKSIQNHTSE